MRVDKPTIDFHNPHYFMNIKFIFMIVYIAIRHHHEGERRKMIAFSLIFWEMNFFL